jgi:hypothetical protein
MLPKQRVAGSSSVSRSRYDFGDPIQSALCPRVWQPERCAPRSQVSFRKFIITSAPSTGWRLVARSP